MKKSLSKKVDKIINGSNKIYFVYINADYPHDKKCREHTFINEVFYDMLKLEQYIKSKYVNINYNILYFDFKKWDIPKDSNIINIVLQTNTLYNRQTLSSVTQYWNYCGEILSELFTTKFVKCGDNELVQDSYFQN